MRKRPNRILVSDKGDEGEQALLLSCVRGWAVPSHCCMGDRKETYLQGKMSAPHLHFLFFPHSSSKKGRHLREVSEVDDCGPGLALK